MSYTAAAHHHAEQAAGAAVTSFASVAQARIIGLGGGSNVVTDLQETHAGLWATVANGTSDGLRRFTPWSAMLGIDVLAVHADDLF